MGWMPSRPLPTTSVLYTVFSSISGPNMDTEVVLVTGASGFLGQHIVKLLHIQSPLTAEIRTLDIVPFENNLGKWSYLKPFLLPWVDFNPGMDK